MLSALESSKKKPYHTCRVSIKQSHHVIIPKINHNSLKPDRLDVMGDPALVQSETERNKLKQTSPSIEGRRENGLSEGS
jgi:hypothetical protein